MSQADQGQGSALYTLHQLRGAWGAGRYSAGERSQKAIKHLEARLRSGRYAPAVHVITHALRPYVCADGYVRLRGRDVLTQAELGELAGMHRATVARHAAALWGDGGLWARERAANGHRIRVALTPKPST